MSFMRRAMLYLGLGPDEDYDEFGQPAPRDARPQVDDRAPVDSPTVRTVHAEPTGIRVVPDPTPTPVPPTAPPPAAAPVHSAVRTVPAPSRSAEPAVVVPASFADAQTVADAFKGRQPVVLNLQNVDADLSRRLIDFASGLCYALDGRMEKIKATRLVYLLKPANVEVGDAERQRLHDRGYSA